MRWALPETCHAFLNGACAATQRKVSPCLHSKMQAMSRRKAPGRAGSRARTTKQGMHGDQVLRRRNNRFDCCGAACYVGVTILK